MNNKEFLAHYGVLGMKWGKSGGRSSSGSKSSGGSKSGEFKPGAIDRGLIINLIKLKKMRSLTKSLKDDAKIPIKREDKARAKKTAETYTEIRRISKDIHSVRKQKFDSEKKNVKYHKENMDLTYESLSGSQVKALKNHKVDRYGLNHDSMGDEEFLAHYGITEEDILAHYGVLGMKWGKRRGSSSSRSNSGSSKGKVGTGERSEDYVKSVKLKRKRPSEMSTAEMKSLNDRLQTEKTYRMLTAKQKSKSRKLVDEIIGGAIKSTAKAYVSKQLGDGVVGLEKKLKDKKDKSNKKDD